MQKTPARVRLNSLPLWRLLVLLADAEAVLGPASPSARVIARVVQDKLRTESEQEVRRGKRRSTNGSEA
jgi:hypothetical protein